MRTVTLVTLLVVASLCLIQTEALALNKKPKQNRPLDEYGVPIPKVKYPYGVKKNLGMKDPPEVSKAAAAEITQLAINAGTPKDLNLPPVPPEVAAELDPRDLPDLRWPVPPNPYNPPKTPPVEYLKHSKPGVYSMVLPKTLKPVTKYQMEQTDEKLKHLKIKQYYAYKLDHNVD